MSGAAWFGSAGARYPGALAVLEFALVLAAGMVVAEMLNGVWIARLLARNKKFARPVARSFPVLVAVAALAVAGYGTAGLRWSVVDAWAASRALWTGLGVVVLMVIGFAVAHRASRRMLFAKVSSIEAGGAAA